MHVEILKVLARNGPSKLTHVMHKVNVNCSVPRQHLDLLIQHNLVEQKTLHKKGTKQESFTPLQKED